MDTPASANPRTPTAGPKNAVVVLLDSLNRHLLGAYGSRDRGPREMFEATCSSCGNVAQVPFKPTSGKPVYCSDCFRSMRGG